jgi:hypothetical protein
MIVGSGVNMAAQYDGSGLDRQQIPGLGGGRPGPAETLEGGFTEGVRVEDAVLRVVTRSRYLEQPPLPVLVAGQCFPLHFGGVSPTG